MSDEAGTVGEEMVPDELHRAYQGLLRKVEGFSEPAMQRGAVRELMDSLDGEQAAWCLDQLIRAVLWGHPTSLEAILATTSWLIEMRVNDDYEQIKTLFMAAHEAGRDAVVDLVREAPAHRSLPKGRGLPEVKLPLARDVTLGERRMMASGSKRRILERLLMDPSPLVLEKLLDNPQIQLQDVVVVGARRPTTPDLLRTLVRHRRWFGRYQVREAVVRNPYCQTGLVLKLLPTMRLKSLREIAYAGDLHPLVHDSARRLVRLREERTAPWRI